MQSSDPIAFDAEVRQVRTMADGTVNVLLNLPEYCMEQAKRFMDWHGLQVRVSAVAIEETFTKLDNETKKGSEASTSGMGRRRIGKRRD